MVLLLKKWIKFRRKPLIVKKARDMSKLTPKVITDKNGHRRTVYVSMRIEAKKEGKVREEPWDSSDNAAKKISVADFGSIDQVKVIAHMERNCETYTHAREILSSLVGHPLTSRFGLKAAISRNSIEKILSTKSVDDSYDFKAHLLAAGNLDKLYTNAIEPWSFQMNPNKNNDGLISVHRLFAPMEYKDQIAVVKITVKKMKNPKDGNRIYSIKALDVFLK